MIGLLRLLHVRHFRRRPMRAVLTALSLAAGVALAVSVMVVQTSFHRSITEFGRTLAGPAPLRVIGPASRGGLDASVVEKVRAVPGVGVAVPLVQAVTMADARDGERSELVTAIGAECAMRVVFGPFDCSAATATPLVSTRLAGRVGDDATLRTDVRSVDLAGAPSSSRLNNLNRGRTVVFPLAVAQHLFGREGAVDVVYVTPAPGVSLELLKDRLAAAVGPQNGVLRATEAPPGIETLLAFMLGLLGMLSLFALTIGAILARNTVVLSLVERRRDLAVAAAVGATPRMLTASVLTEVGVLGAVGGLLGAGGGALLARPVLAGIDQFASRMIGAHLGVHVSATVVAVAVVIGVGAAVLATWRPARSAARLDVAAELVGRDLAEETRPGGHIRRGAALVGVGFAGVALTSASARGGGLEQWQPLAAQAGVLVTCIGFVGAVGSFAPVVAGLLARALGGAPGPVRLGLANIARSRRTGIMTIAVASAVGVAFSIASTTRSIHDAVESDILRDRDRVSINTVPISNALNIDGKPWPSTIEALAHFPGVTSVERLVAMLVRQPDGSTIGVIGSDTPGVRLDGALARGTADPDRFARGEVVIGPRLARRFDVHPGDTIDVATRTSGVVRLTVQGVEQFGDFGGTMVRMPMAMIERLYGSQPPSYVAVRVAPGADPDAVAHAIEAAHLQPHLEARGPSAIASAVADDVSAQIEPFWALQRALVVVTFVAVLFTLLLSAIQRRRELGVLGAIGMRPGEVAAMIVTEGATVGITGAVLGSIAAIAFVVAMGDATTVVIGFQDPLRFDLAAPFLWGGLCLAVVLAAASWPAWRAARTEVLPALQYE